MAATNHLNQESEPVPLNGVSGSPPRFLRFWKYAVVCSALLAGVAWWGYAHAYKHSSSDGDVLDGFMLSGFASLFGVMLLVAWAVCLYRFGASRKAVVCALVMAVLTAGQLAACHMTDLIFIRF